MQCKALPLVRLFPEIMHKTNVQANIPKKQVVINQFFALKSQINALLVFLMPEFRFVILKSFFTHIIILIYKYKYPNLKVRKQKIL